MNIPSLSSVVAWIVGGIVLLNASGRGQVVWSALAEMRKEAKVATLASWGCPSIFDRRACTRYTPRSNAR
jgi:hypothetical protein